MKRMPTVIISIVLSISMCGCSEEAISKDTKETVSVSSQTETTTEQTTAESITETKAQMQTTTVQTENGNEKLDPFEGLEVQFDGISPYAHLSINNSKCPKAVQDNITYSYDETANIANGSSITIKAALNENDKARNYELVNDQKEFLVEGLPYYVDDFSKIDCSTLDKEIQQYMDAHYLYSNKYDRMMQKNKTYGDGWGTSGIMGVRLDEPLDRLCYKGFNGSKVEQTYSLLVKPNFVSECKVGDADISHMNEKNTYNYYFRQYKNNYTVETVNKYVGQNNIPKQYKVDVYAIIYIKNVIADSDGTLRYDKQLDYYTSAVPEQAYFSAISSKSDKYNISKVMKKT